MARKLYKTRLVVMMQGGSHNTDQMAVSRDPWKSEEAPNKWHGREDGRGNLDLGWGGLVP